jgi:hypothetical protein
MAETETPSETPALGWAAGATPLVGLSGAILAVVLALVLGWPMLAVGGELVFADTESYVRGGRIVWTMGTDLLGDLLGVAPEGGGGIGDGGDALVNARGEPIVVRSFIYSAYTFVAGAQIWRPGFALLQAAMTLWMLFALIGRDALARPGILGVTFLYLAAFTTLPWFAAYQMPDLLAATVILWGAILVWRFDDLRPWQQVALALIAAFAVAAHYGHGAVAAALYGAVLLWRLVRRRLTLAVVVAAAFPVLFAPLANLGASSVALDKPSVTPLRLPILLARSIADGPARWYLEDACPEAPLAFCEAFGDEVPRINEFLWGEEGIDSLSPELLDRIRDEEFLVLARAFREYPLEQSISLFGNGALQIVRVGLGGIRVDVGEGASDARARAVVGTFDRIVPWTTWAAGALLTWLALRRRLGRAELETAAVVVLGLLVNAAIFGGLSAPVDRYQSRAIWLLPALAGIFIATRAGRPRGG